MWILKIPGEKRKKEKKKKERFHLERPFVFKSDKIIFQIYVS